MQGQQLLDEVVAPSGCVEAASLDFDLAFEIDTRVSGEWDERGSTRADESEVTLF